MNHESRYIVGIDLGTTNCALASIDTKDGIGDDVAIDQFTIPQLIKAGEVDDEELLASFVYLPVEGEVAPAQLALPWTKERDFAVGRFARDHGSLTPTRLVSSAKSWLCHPGVDRRGKILPWTAEAEFAKISPVDAQVRLLEHLRDAWNHKVAGKDKANRLENQEIVLTVPASFDPVARELTLEAATQAGLLHVTLFEEPQAAFYAWIHHGGNQWRRQIKPGDVALVVDVGGGTTDLTLIGVGEENGELALTRLAVGEHLLLGGDNMDLTLAHSLAQSFQAKGTKLDTTQMLQLWHACRLAKEKLFLDPKAKSQPVTVLGRGRKVVGGTLRADLTRQSVEEILVDGFFPKTELGSEPVKQRAIGLQELGLAYAADPAITKHLSSFLGRHADQIETARQAGKAGDRLPSAVLFNGGVFNAEPLRQRVIDVLAQWSGATGAAAEAIRELPTAGLDRAVARGAAYYGLVRRGHGVRIRGGVARSYYIGVETAMPTVPGMPGPLKALCVVPKGMEEGTEAELTNREFGLVVGQPVEFQFLGSTSRESDVIGTMVDDWEETIAPIAPLRTTLDAEDLSGQIPVRLHSKVTEVGTLELWCQSRDGSHRWKLEFSVREPE